MLAHGRGAIVNIASMSGSIVNRDLLQVHYNASKAAVIHLSKSLAMEWAPRGIRVNGISPGYTATPMNTRPEVAEQVKRFEADTPLGRMAAPTEMVGPAVFLLSRRRELRHRHRPDRRRRIRLLVIAILDSDACGSSTSSRASPSADAVYEAFLDWAEEQGLSLYPHQEEAAIELFSGNNVILATPTGSGKSMVAVAAHFAALADDRDHVLHGADQGAREREVLRSCARSSAPRTWAC